MHDSLIIGTHHIAIGHYYGFFIAKIDLSGSVLWVAHDATSTYLIPDHVTTDSADNIYITGTVTDSPGTITTIGPDTIHHAVYVAKYTPSGTFSWVSSISADYGAGIAVTSAGAVYICGNFHTPTDTIGPSVIYDPYPFANAYLAEFSPAGIPVWAIAATGSDGANAFDLTRDDYDNIYITGYYADTSITFGSVTATSPYPAWGYGVLYLFKFSPAHTALWGKAIGSHTATVFGWSVSTSSCSNQVWVTGNLHAAINIDGHILNPPPSAPDPCFIAGYDFSGAVAGYACLSSGGDDLSGVACDRFGNVYVAGDYEYFPIVIGPDTLNGAVSLGEYMYVGKYGFAKDTMTTYTDSIWCGSYTTTLTAPMGYSSYVWNDSELIQNRTISAAGNYTVYCNVCNHMLIDTFHVVNITDSLFNRRDTTVCVLSEHPAVHLVGPAGGTGNHWSNGDTLSTDSVVAPGIYWLNYFSGCTFYSDTINVIFHFIPAAITGKDTICAGNFTTYHDATASGVWSSSNTSVVSVGSSGAVSGLSAGTAIITYNTGCSVTKTITVLGPPCVNAVVMPEAANDRVELYPVPVSGTLYIKADESVYNSFSIKNNIGQLLLCRQLETGETTIDVSSYPPGLYFISFSGENGINNLKFIKW